MSFLILTPEQAQEVRGSTAPGHALEPRQVLIALNPHLLMINAYVLPLAVRGDTHHLRHSVQLASLPQGEIVWPEILNGD